MLAIVAPGQGAQKPGLLTPWLEIEGVSEALAQATATTRLDLVALGTKADADTIRDTAIAQPLLVAVGLVAGVTLLQGGHGDVYAGHSVGELTVAGLSGILSYPAAVKLAARRGREMAEAADLAPTGMSAVLGGDQDAVVAAITAAGLEVANYNGPGQIVAAGELAKLDHLRQYLPPRSRAVPLAVAGAFHTSFMVPALAVLAAAVDVLEPGAPHGIVLSNLDGAAVTSGADLLARLVPQITHPVRWDLVLKSLEALGVTGLLELPPAGTLTAIAKRHLPGVELFQLDRPDQLDAARAFCARHQAAA